jgi:hypothetical protein
MGMRLVTAALGGAAMLATWAAPTPLAVLGGEGVAQAAEARGGDGRGGGAATAGAATAGAAGAAAGARAAPSRSASSKP